MADARVWGRVSRRMLLGALFSFLVLVFAPLFFWLVEHGRNEYIDTPWNAYQWLFRTLFENTSPYKLRSKWGYLSYYIVRVAGVSLVAFLTGTIASRFVATVIQRGAGMGEFKGQGHVLICGWSPKGAEIIRDYRSKEVESTNEIVILADLETDPIDADKVTFIRGNPSNADDLRRAGIERVKTAIILSDLSSGGTDPDDLDARALLTTLAVESLNPDCYSCVEVVKSENRQHFERTHANELVVSAELTGSLLAASARTHGLSALIADLLTHPEGQEFYRIDTPPELVGSTVGDALVALKLNADSLLVGVYRDETNVDINPARERVLEVGHGLLVIRDHP
jgi:voltage-gated potassium channel